MLAKVRLMCQTMCRGDVVFRRPCFVFYLSWILQLLMNRLNKVEIMANSINTTLRRSPQQTMVPRMRRACICRKARKFWLQKSYRNTAVTLGEMMKPNNGGSILPTDFQAASVPYNLCHTHPTQSRSSYMI